MSLPIKGQVKDIGIPLIHNFTKETYNAGTQNWAIAQDKKGIMYFGNNQGLLEFDGYFWKIYPLPNASVVRSVCISKDQKIFLGGLNEFGYMYPNEKGILIYHSLKEYLKNKDIGEIWKIYEMREGIVFHAFNYVYLWNGKELKVIIENSGFLFSFLVNNTLYIQDRGKGIYKYENSKLEFINGSELFIPKEIWAMFPISGKNIVIGTFNDGLYLFDGTAFKQFDIKPSDYVKQNQIFCSALSSDNLVAIGTIQNGVIIFNEYGEVLQLLDRQKGLQNNTVLSAFFDSNKNLWLGLDNGIDYIEVNSPVSYLVKKKAIGAGYAAVMHNSYIYLGTNQGLFRTLWSYGKETENKIEKIDNSQGQVWSLFSVNGKLLCGHDKGTFEIVDNKAYRITNPGSWKFLPYPGNPDVLLNGTYSGINILQLKNGCWGFKNRVKGFGFSSRLMEIDKDTNIWVCHGNQGIYRIKMNSTLDSVLLFKFYGANEGFKAEHWITLGKIDNKVLFNTHNGIYQYNAYSDKFELAEELTEVFKTKQIGYISQGFENLSWYISNSEAGVLLKHLDGNYSIENTSLKKISGSFISSFENILQLNNKNVIMAVEDGFIHFNPQFRTTSNDNPKCFIRQVSFSSDSVIFGGNSFSSANIIVNNEPLRYSKEAIKFSYVSNDYADNEKSSFKYTLDNFDNQWSDWSNLHTKEYTNLPEGTYIFKVIAKNIYGNQSNVASYRFTVSPPWFRSVVAYTIYIIGILIVLLLSFNSIKRKFEKEKHFLKVKQKKILEEKEQQHAQEVMISQQEIVKLRNEMLELENERNKAEVELKKKELASLATQITRKNEVLEKIKIQLNKLNESIKAEDRKKLNSLIKSIDQDIKIDEDWERFERYFDQVHGDFIKRLRENFPNLTPTDLKLCAYLKMNISSKEIAPLLNISVRSVEVSRYRLRKKLNLTPSDNLIDFMLNI